MRALRCTSYAFGSLSTRRAIVAEGDRGSLRLGRVAALDRSPPQPLPTSSSQDRRIESLVAPVPSHAGKPAGSREALAPASVAGPRALANEGRPLSPLPPSAQSALVSSLGLLGVGAAQAGRRRKPFPAVRSAGSPRLRWSSSPPPLERRRLHRACAHSSSALRRAACPASGVPCRGSGPAEPDRALSPSPGGGARSATATPPTCARHPTPLTPLRSRPENFHCC